MYQEERRHFESESVRIYKEISGGGTRASYRRPTMVSKKALKLEVTLEADPEQRLRAYEQRHERARQEAMIASDEGPEATQARERLYNKVAASLRGDMRRGFMMPADYGAGEKQTTKNFARPRRAVATKGVEEQAP